MRRCNLCGHENEDTAFICVQCREYLQRPYLMRWRLVIPSIVAIMVIALLGGIALSRAKRRARSFSCISNVTRIVLAGKMWSEDHGGYFPTNLSNMSNELNSPIWLYCPADPQPRRTLDWTARDYSYELVSPGAHVDGSSRMVVRCKLHANAGYIDSSMNGWRVERK